MIWHARLFVIHGTFTLEFFIFKPYPLINNISMEMDKLGVMTISTQRLRANSMLVSPSFLWKVPDRNAKGLPLMGRISMNGDIRLNTVNPARKLKNNQKNRVKN